MGIVQFFSSLDRNFNVVTNLEEPYQRIDASHFLIDFNSIIHNVSADMLSKINKYKKGEIDVLDFNFNKLEDFEPELINQIKKSIIRLLNKNFISENIKYVMLAIDGVPSFAKMMEQKKRRYIGDLISKLMKQFELPIEWSKNNISPGTKFMDNLCKELERPEFFQICKETCVNLEGVLVSNVYNPGEGEMKIMNCIKGLKSTRNKICVYSPDSDMILLLMILNIPVILLRYDQQLSKKEDKSIFNLIDVNKFKEELVKYCSIRINVDNKRLLIDEIIYIFTLFGDDFLPRLESIQVSSDINVIIDNYLLTVISKGHIIQKEGSDYKINHDNLKYFFSKLTKFEIQDINRNFYLSKYNNYYFANNKNFHFDLQNFKSSVNDIIVKFILKNMYLKRINSVCTPLNVATCIDVGFFYDFFISKLDKSFDYNKNASEVSSTKTNLNQDIYDSLINKLKRASNSNDEYYNFIYNITKIIDGSTLYQILYGDGILGSGLFDRRSIEFQDKIRKYKSLYYLELSDEELIQEIIIYLYLQPLQLPFLNFNLDSDGKRYKLNKRSFNIRDHSNKLRKEQLLNKGREREKLQYIIENKLENYDKLFNPEHPFYSEKVRDLSQYNNKIFTGIDTNKVIEVYIQGFEWILNYYFNGKTDLLWHYPYTRTPLLSDIIRMYPVDIPALNFVEGNYFNPLESIIFISPIEPGYPLEFFPDTVTPEVKQLIQQFMTQNRFFFLQLSEINTNLTRDITSLPDLLDCSTSIFINKCHFKLLESNNNPELFIQNFRKIIPLESQPLVNINTFKCVKLKLD